MPKSYTDLTTDQWGPTFWKLLHVMASRVGTDDAMIDSDVANCFYFVIHRLHEVLPCAECQAHTKAYLSEHKFDPRAFSGSKLHNYIALWLLTFHNTVRAQKGKPIIVGNVEEYQALWRPQTLLPCNNEELKLYFIFGKTYHIINIGKFASWNNQLQRLRLLLGV